MHDGYTSNDPAKNILPLCSQVESVLKIIRSQPKTVIISKSVYNNLTLEADVQFTQDSATDILHISCDHVYTIIIAETWGIS